MRCCYLWQLIPTSTCKAKGCITSNCASNGLSEGTVYAKRMVGMRPKVMPLDENLNQDVHESVDRCMNLKAHLLDSYLDNFSKRTPNHLACVYKQIWELIMGIHSVALTHKQIKEDVTRLVQETHLKNFA